MNAILHERSLRPRRAPDGALGANPAAARTPRRAARRRTGARLPDRALSFDFASAADAEEFRCAFYRFVELNSRAVVDPAAHCSIAIQRVGRKSVAEVGLWSARAAAEFAGFWPRYAQVYGRRSVFALRG